ncbi:hypothetical protein AAY473_025274 [Plecturocebus cupreus]
MPRVATASQDQAQELTHREPGVTNCHKLGDNSRRSVFALDSGGWKPELTVLAGLGSPGGSSGHPVPGIFRFPSTWRCPLDQPAPGSQWGTPLPSDAGGRTQELPTAFPGKLECNGAISAHHNFHILVSSNSPTSPSRVAGTIVVRHHALEHKTGFLCIGQTGLELPTSGDPPTSASQSAGITALSHRAQPINSFFNGSFFWPKWLNLECWSWKQGHALLDIVSWQFNDYRAHPCPPAELACGIIGVRDPKSGEYRERRSWCLSFQEGSQLLWEDLSPLQRKLIQLFSAKAELHQGGGCLSLFLADSIPYV